MSCISSLDTFTRIQLNVMQFLQRLRYEDKRKPGQSKTLLKLPQTNKGRFKDHSGQGSYPMQSLPTQRRA